MSVLYIPCNNITQVLLTPNDLIVKLKGTKQMYNQSIKHKLILMTGIILLLIGISGVLIFHTVTPVADSWSHYQQHAAMRQKLLMDIKGHFGYGGMIHNFKNYVLRGQEKYVNRIEKDYRELTIAVKHYRRLDDVSGDEKVALTAIQTVAKTYYDNSHDIKQMFAADKHPEDIDSIVKISDAPAFEAFKTLDNHYRQMTNDSSNQINGALSDAKLTMVISLLFVALLVVGGLGFLYLQVIPPLWTLNKTLHDIAEGTGDLSHRLDQSRKDELGEVALSFNTFITKIRNIIVEEKSIIEQITNSSLDLKTIANSSNHAIESQLSHTEQLASAIEQMTITVGVVAKNANVASDSTAQAEHTAEGGQEAVTNTVNQIQNIHQHLSEASEVISGVNTASDKIGQVLSVISEIADQTNLLALNAAIEAARAGESGRGFAVVADEVRGLAQRTAVSLADIHNIINQLQSGARGAVATMEQGVKEVATGAKIAQQAGGSIGNIVTEMSTIHDMNVQIATATEEQNVVATDMNVSVHQISSMSSSIFRDSQQLAEQSENLATMTARLQELASNFQT